MRLLTVLLTVLCGVIVAINAGDTATETWEQKGSYRNGYVLNFILGIRDSFVAAPDGYSDEIVASLEEEYSGDTKETEGDEQDPTIIVIMNESFSDLSVLGDFETNKELTPFMDSLEENTLKGYALSSVFGAKTPNSEWEFMTGNSMAFLPAGSVVYQQYISDTPTSIVSNLKDMGYTCVAMHPYYATGWSRNQVYPNLGYDETYFIDDFDQTKLLRKYITDQELYDKIIDRYENRKTNEKLYLMGITMQNHGGYTETYDNFDEDCYKIGRSYTDANQYLSLVHQSDIALENLITYFSQVDDPVEIVFFGDHQPSLNSAFYPLLNGKGLSGLTEDELEALYTVPFFIWTNYETKAETVDITSLNYLSTLTLERAGLTLPAYNQFLADMMEVVPAINSRGYYSIEQGGYVHVDQATGQEKAWINKYQILQYNSMFDKKGRSSVFFPYNILK
jgi:phosphoglycerol transferase MdoB-like AlkP superfamily enzyme